MNEIPPPARIPRTTIRWLMGCVASLTALLAALLVGPLPSGATIPTAGNRVGVHAVALGDLVEPSQRETAGQQLGNKPAHRQIVVATGVAANTADDAVAITSRYSRPSGGTTRAEREAVQGLPCVDCGTIAERQVADHIDPLVTEYYRTGTIDLERMRSLGAVQPQCPICSVRQGAELSRYSVYMRRLLGLE